MQFDTKLAVVIANDLPTWQKLNVTAFTVSGIASLVDTVGEPYVDASDRTYLPMIKQPILIFGAERSQLRDVYDRATAADVQLSIYTAELFATPHDDANRAAVRAVASANLDLVGMALRGRKKLMDKLLKGLMLHP